LRAIQIGAEAHLTSSTVDAGGFPGLKRPVRGSNRSPSFSFELQMGRGHNLTFPPGQHRHVMGDLYLYLTLKIKEDGMDGG